MRFVSVGVETANPRMSSICQIGLVTFDAGREVSAEVHLIDPREYFDPFNVRVHGITEDDVRGKPRFHELLPWLTERTSGEVVACHTHFDRVALQHACDRSKSASLPCTWLDTARVTRRTWSEFAEGGYGLANVAAFLGISFRHHDALEDARAAGHILLRAMEVTGLGPTEWVARCRSGVSSPSCGSNVRREGDGDGPLLGESLVFSGALQITRSRAADRAHEAGAAVEPGVTKRTTMLVIEQVQDGVVDVALLYAPPHRTGVTAELLVDEKLVAVSTFSGRSAIGSKDYVYVDWGEDFASNHHAAFPGATSSGLTVNHGPLAMEYLLSVGGTAYLRQGAAKPYLDAGRLFLVEDEPSFAYSVYAVYSSKADEEVMDRARHGLRIVANVPT